jgi:hypothetical protein
MMQPPNPQTADPLVEILRLAYRRGRVLRQQSRDGAMATQAEQNQNKTVDSDNLGGAALSTAEQQDPKIEESHQ